MGVFGWAFMVEPRLLQVKHVEIPMEGLSRPLKALLVADTQSLRLHWSEERLAEVLKPLAETQRPDVIFLLGDYSGLSHGPARKLYNDWMRVDPEAAARILGGLQAPMGVYAVLGNHDWFGDGHAVAAALRAGGATVLDNDHVEVRTPAGDRLIVAGVDDPLGPRGARPDLALAGTDPSKPLIFLTHRPDEALKLPRPASLSLAGHTHGGQVCLPLVGCPAKTSPNGFMAGRYETAKGDLYISTGVGTAALPFRLGQPPEIVALTLTPAPAAPQPEEEAQDKPRLVAQEAPAAPQAPHP